MRLYSSFDARMVCHKGPSSRPLKMDHLSQSGLLVDISRRGLLIGQLMTGCKDQLTATVRTEFLQGLLKSL